MNEWNNIQMSWSNVHIQARQTEEKRKKVHYTALNQHKKLEQNMSHEKVTEKQNQSEMTDIMDSAEEGREQELEERGLGSV